MKTYLKFISYFQEFLLGISILIMLVLPLVLVFYPDLLSSATTMKLYDISHWSVFFVMIIRPLADIFKKAKFLRLLVPLRKGMGVLSASVVLSFIFSKIIMQGWGYFAAIGTAAYWSMENYALLAHLADLSAVVLIITSNVLSRNLLGNWWKRVQKLSYVYFYASSLYVLATFGTPGIAISVFIVTLLTVVAHMITLYRSAQTAQVVPQQ